MGSSPSYVSDKVIPEVSSGVPWRTTSTAVGVLGVLGAVLTRGMTGELDLMVGCDGSVMSS